MLIGVVAVAVAAIALTFFFRIADYHNDDIARYTYYIRYVCIIRIYNACHIKRIDKRLVYIVHIAQ